jgi:hypothetical protein
MYFNFNFKTQVDIFMQNNVSTVLDFKLQVNITFLES